MLDKHIKKQFGSWAAYSRHIGKNPSNFKRTFLQNIAKINKWLEPLGLEIGIKDR